MDAFAATIGHAEKDTTAENITEPAWQVPSHQIAVFSCLSPAREHRKTDQRCR